MITTTSRIRGKKVPKLTKQVRETKNIARIHFVTEDQSHMASEAPQAESASTYIFSPEFVSLSEEEGLPALPGDETTSSSDSAQLNPKLIKNLPSYLLRLCEAKLLTPTLERALFRRMNFAKYRAEFLQRQIKGSRIGLNKQKKIADLQTRGLADRNRIVAANLRLVVSIAKKFADLNNTFDDLLSEGITTLMHAVDKFDYSRGFRFSTYATLAVRRSLYRLVMNHRTDRTRFVATETAKLAENPAEENTGTMTEARWSHLQTSLAKLLGKLEPREREIIRRRFGLDRRREVMTLQSIARELGVCKERVRQLEQRAIMKLQTMAAHLEMPADASC